VSDQTPRVPKLWWSEKVGVIHQGTDGAYSTDDWHPLIELPADAVELVPANGEGGRAIREAARDALKRKIREVLIDVDADDFGTAYEALDRIEAIVEGETR
jgi:hypothetical protein